MNTLLLIETPVNIHITIYAPGKTLPPLCDCAVMIGPEAIKESHVEVEWQEDTSLHLTIAEGGKWGFPVTTDGKHEC